MILLAIDPGPTESAFVAHNSETGGIRNAGKQPNDVVLGFLREGLAPEVACVVIEKVEGYGMPGGRRGLRDGVLERAVRPGG
jgi:hypothetical protein